MNIETQPFLHAVIDDFLPDEMLLLAREKMSLIPDRAWLIYRSQDERKAVCNDLVSMCQPLRSLMTWFSTSAYIRWLAAHLIGQKDIDGDGGLWGAGVSCMKNSDWLGIHADSVVHPVTGLHRRVNVILYCTPHWELYWGGELLLWNGARTHPQATIFPYFNRLVLFAAGPDNYHSVDTIHSPDVNRLAISAYFWSPPLERARFVSKAGEAVDPVQEHQREVRSRGYFPELAIKFQK